MVKVDLEILPEQEKLIVDETYKNTMLKDIYWSEINKINTYTQGSYYHSL